MGFVGLPLRLELLATKRSVWRVVEGYQYEGDDFTVEVPQLWVTDLTSIPWWLPFWRREGEHTPASVVHDVVYARGRVIRDDKEIDVSRSFADREVYLRAMEDLKTPAIRRRLLYLGVRIGGWWTWSRFRKKQALEDQGDP